MRDSRIGAMGVLALLAVFALKCAALVAVPESARWSVLVLMALAGRCSIVLQLHLLPYARQDGGLCSVFVSHRSHWDWAIALVVLGGGAWLLRGWEGLATAACAIAALAVFAAWCRRKIGGFTGDTLGAGCEIIELVPAMVAVAWWRATTS